MPRPATCDIPESIVATRRAARWNPEDREWLDALPPPEHELVLLLVAHLGARPTDEKETA
jgi:hypothetical protein